VGTANFEIVECTFSDISGSAVYTNGGIVRDSKSTYTALSSNVLSLVNTA
jgi:hypothetical protein